VAGFTTGLVEGWSQTVRNRKDAFKLSIPSGERRIQRGGYIQRAIQSFTFGRRTCKEGVTASSQSGKMKALHILET
jgi:hypothetical protein